MKSCNDGYNWSVDSFRTSKSKEKEEKQNTESQANNDISKDINMERILIIALVAIVCIFGIFAFYKMKK
jgi:uncharacterized membrane protein YvbJ